MEIMPGNSAHADYVARQAVVQGARWAERPCEGWQLVQIASLQVDELQAEPGALIATLKLITDPDHLLTMATWSDVVLGVPDASDTWAALFAHGARVRVFDMLKAGGAGLMKAQGL